MLPEGQLFHENLFTRLRRLGPDQLRRVLRQRLVTAPPGYIKHDRRVYNHNRQREGPVEGQNHIGLDVQHDAVGLPENLGENGAASRNAQSTAQHCAAAGINQIFVHDLPVCIAQRFQGADLGSFFVDHPGHGGDADQRRNQDEEHREHPGNASHDIRGAVQIVVAHVAVSIQNHEIRLVHGINLIPGVQQLLLRVL